MLGIVALTALIVAVVISCVSEKNVGMIAIAFAFLIATFAGDALKVSQLNSFFPIRLFMIVIGATFFFSMATTNGTVEKIARYAVKSCGGRTGLIPIIFFILAWGLSSIGPGNIATTVVLAPIGMALAGATRISPFLMTLMIVNGANAGALSPIAPTGIIANGLVENAQMDYIGTGIWLNSLLGNGVAGAVGYIFFGGLKLWGSKLDPDVQQKVKDIVNQKIEPFSTKQWITIAAICSWIFCVLFLGWDVGYSAIMFGILLSFLGCASEKEAFKVMPWFSTFMLCGVMVIVEVAAKTGGLDYAIKAIAAVSTRTTVSSIFGFITGFVSIYSGSSAVVMPTFIPLIGGLVEQLGVVGDAAVTLKNNLVYACCVSAHLVDASPLSLLGALCIASAPEWQDRNKLFRDLLIWGMAMSVFAGVICFIFWH